MTNRKKVKDPLTVVIVGLGRMGRNHYRVISEDSRFKIVGVIDKKLSGADQLRLKTERVKYWKDITVVSELKPDVVIVAVSTEAHFDVVNFLLGETSFVLVEKPLADTLANANKLYQAIKRSRTKVVVGHVERFNPAVVKLEEVIARGWIGKPIHFSFTRVGGYPTNVKPTNNVLVDLAVHDLDVFGMLCGPVSLEASVCHSTWRPGIYDTAEILARSKSGASASIHVNWITPTKIRTVRVTGTKGVCSIDYMLQTCELWGGAFLTTRPEPKIEFGDLVEAYKNGDRVQFGVSRDEPLKQQLDAIYQELTEPGPTRFCSAREALLNITLAEKAIQYSVNRRKR